MIVANILHFVFLANAEHMLKIMYVAHAEHTFKILKRMLSVSLTFLSYAEHHLQK
jgi:hypothetical protein